MNTKKVFIVVALFCSQFVFAHPSHTPPTMPKEFETLKQLVGTWTGTSKMGDKAENVSVVYELSSGGTVVTEKLMPGTPNEMITVYYKEGPSLAMTHYCALGNHPMMRLKKSDDKTMVFEMTKPIGVTSMKEPHMHALTLTLADANTLKQEWVHFDGGVQKNTAAFSFTRKQ